MHRVLAVSLVLGTAGTFGAPAACAQTCGAQWLPGEPGAGLNNYVVATTVWDPDGPGPGAAQLVIAGDFTTAGGEPVNHIARHDGMAWQPLGAGIGGYLYALTTWDPDGPGPEPANIVAGGTFSTAGGAPAARIARWDGMAWHPLGTGVNAQVSALVSWDPDGPGPMGEQLIAGGDFHVAGGVAVNSIARWDGASWNPLGTGVSGPVSALATWDPDGSGPQSSQLVAGGRFTTAGGIAANRIARWDGLAWHALGAGVNEFGVRAITEWDPDGPGSLPAELIVGGGFTTAGGAPASYIARWDGSIWSTMGTGMNAYVHSLTTWDPDGSGPQLEQPIAGGNFTTAGGLVVNYVARWDGGAWHGLDAGMNYAVNTLARWDPDGAGPSSVELVSGGHFTGAAGTAAAFAARWDGSAWRAIGAGFNGFVRALATWDHDGPGPERAQIFAGGDFSAAGDASAWCIARWDGAGWHALGTTPPGVNSSVYALTTWDSDGPGSQPAHLIAGGTFTNASGVAANRVARWDGTGWHALGNGLNDRVYALCTWDLDGTGPLPPHLIAGGMFTSAGPTGAKGVARWDGADWHPLGTGIVVAVMALAPFDRDGAGPEPAHLIAGGAFQNAGGVPASQIARWDGTAWHPLGAGMDSGVTGLTNWDPDGPGPLPAHLIAGGSFFTAGGLPANHIARWDGAAWHALGPGLNAPVFALAGWDPDESGPEPTALIAGGWFTAAGSAPASYIARWDGSAWSTLGSGTNGGVTALAPSSGGGLCLGGWFSRAGGQISAYFARWTHSNAPWVALHPEPQTVIAGGNAEFSATPADGFLNLSAVWQLETAPGSGVYAPLDDGPIPGATPAIAAITQPSPTANPGPTRLTITGVTMPLHARRVRALVSNACGVATSDAAILMVLCYADCDSTGTLNVNDYICFQTKFALGDPYADCDGNGVRNVNDYICFQTRFALGCP